MPDPSACAADHAWRAAVQHPFLDAVRDGTLPETAFAGLPSHPPPRRRLPL